MYKIPSIECESKCRTERNCRISLGDTARRWVFERLPAQGPCEMSSVTELISGFKGKWDFLRMHPAFRMAPMRTTLRLASWRARCLLRTAATVHLRRSGVRMYLPPNWRGVAKLIYAFRDNYEPELAYLERVLSPGKVFVDAGANFGIYTLLASRLEGGAGRSIPFGQLFGGFLFRGRNFPWNVSRIYWVSRCRL